MLRYIFGTSAPTTTDKVDTSLAKNLPLEAVTTLVMHLKTNEEVYQCFMALTIEQQNHIFPLLSSQVRDRIFASFFEDRQRQHELITEWEAYCQQKREAVVDANHPQSFFFCMKEGNHEIAKLTDLPQVKQSFLVPMSRLAMFDLKPYKYQRRLMERHIECIMDGIRESGTLFHPIILAYVPCRNSLTILDGQHRWNALKRLPDLNIKVQLDVYTFTEDDDEEVMRLYKYINTNVPIDNSILERELEYVSLVADLKREFGSNQIRHFKKDHESIPVQFVDDTNLKFELQYRDMLTRLRTSQAIVNKLKAVNETIKACSKYTDDLSMIERRLCEKNNFYLGVRWPLCIELLEDYAPVKEG